MNHEDFLWNLSSIENLTGPEVLFENRGDYEVYDFENITITWNSLGYFTVSSPDFNLQKKVEFELSLPRCGICRSTRVGIVKSNEGCGDARVFCNSCGAREYYHWDEFIPNKDEKIKPRQVNWAAAEEIIKKKEIDFDDSEIPF